MVEAVQLVDTNLFGSVYSKLLTKESSRFEELFESL
jgi:hypothetical protein